MAKKILFSAANGAVVLEEEGGEFSLKFSKAALIGGGAAAGIIAVEGEGSAVLKGKMAFDLGMAFLIAHSPPALVPFEQAAQGIADAAIDKA